MKYMEHNYSFLSFHFSLYFYCILLYTFKRGENQKKPKQTNKKWGGDINIRIALDSYSIEYCVYIK